MSGLKGMLQHMTYPPEASQVPGPLYRRGEPTGMVFCPLRLSSIAVMKCGEYQALHGCGAGCAQAVSAAAVAELRGVMERFRTELVPDLRVRGKERYPGSKTCIVCGREKKTNIGKRCRSCATLNNRGGKASVAAARRKLSGRKTGDGPRRQATGDGGQKP
jgi:hypothetical protein